MKFALRPEKKLSGAEAAIRIYQIASILPIFYIFAVSGYMSLVTRRGVLSSLFDFGICTLPRAQALLLSFIYRLSSSEILVNFIILFMALAAGLIMNSLLRGKGAKGVRIALAVFILCDIVLCLLPLPFNKSFGIVFSILAVAVKAVCLVFIILDLRGSSKE